MTLFNNELNTNAQMIFTVHDINLMDCKRMFRKEQIWFVHKDEEGVYVYSLADFTAQQGVRDTTDIMEKYRKGTLGALPDPELINSLLSINETLVIICRKLYPDRIDAVWDELVANAGGIRAAFGRFDAKTEKIFLGIEGNR